VQEIVECPDNLVYISHAEKGYTRIKRGRGFSYHLHNGDRIENPKIVERIKALGIPPMWKKVWICQDPNGHLQATGYDQKNRKQYIYHQDWVTFRNLAKFNRIREFGLALPSIREYTSAHLQEKGWPKEKVISLVIQMMDEYHIRIGNQYYKEQNETFGVTTLRRKHLDFEQGVGRLEYKAKSGKYRKINLQNNQLTKLVKECADLPGYEIFTYRDVNKKYQSISSQDVNEHLHQIAGESFSCKDFRTWGGTTMTVEKREIALEEIKENPRLKLESTLVKKVAQELGNTLSVCREYYMHPLILEKAVLEDFDAKAYMSKKKLELSNKHKRLLRESETVVLNILNEFNYKATK